MGRRGPYTLADLDETQWPQAGDYLWIADLWTIIVTEVERHPEGLAFVGLSCFGPTDGGVAWGPGPHEWYARAGVLAPGREFRILPAEAWPRLPVQGDQITITVDPPYQILVVADAPTDEGRIPSRARTWRPPPDGVWRVAGQVYTFNGDPLGDDTLDIALQDRAAA